ncbi:MAG: LpxL/LpxP family Kdo(2)-lipid IV(A) lauroyl/palmitoleoyl acyltransferase [Xanthomonadaceae bacterium]|nr:LpxL/LpxP family Kdo(2)-lipid IV(A) lauroyl/palmitoleoyl acyltransferase [Xanthomonadaceae bacterium]MDE2083758.1 LpxL/LpxP family Kdo(2)-lipid IV(A) lauroyl/palmitoleoyl acyltransferase [Xanthomonadaceae bacterium]MDE2257793.1 LpxL/LpxP family Kdo(2)-lipid IV(A) lauroyl/palmitoleoyl acyltransferase [Xanthomonadaceae bacterium]
MSKLSSPRYWPSWIGLGVVRLIARLPYRALLSLGRGLGHLTARLPGSRRHVAQRNLALCLPELADAERARLLRRNLADLGLMFAEFAFAWFGSDRAIAGVPCAIQGMEHLERCRAQGRGVLLVGAHFSHLELCARLVSQRIRIAGMYRVMDDPVFERAVLRARLRYAEAMFTKDELRASVKYLKRGGTLWYAPDQDMRGKDCVFAPFFGIAASTLTATHHLARLSGAAVIPFFHRREPNGGYAIRLEAPLENFPSDDIVADTTRVNENIERMVREAPEQYLWVHKRFKTRPQGTPPVY